MKLRKNILPRTIADFSATTFLLGAIPTIFYFELWIVLPTVHETGATWYMIHASLAVFVLINILSNMFAVMMCDTSIQGEMLSPKSSEAIPAARWNYCAVCECFTPPRSWHCNTCKTCILKRDHHCVFTGCCVGHRNHRYFFYLIFYLFIGTTYSTYFNHWFVWSVTDLMNGWNVLKIIFPLAMLVWDSSTDQFYLVMYLLNLAGMLICGTLLVYHGQLLKTGSVVPERKSPIYDVGLKRNFVGVFGQRWYLTWLSPFVDSPLPHNGINWDTKDTVKGR